MIKPIDSLQARAVPRGAPPPVDPAVSFSTVMQGALENGGDVRFSNHALQRLRDRDIELNPQQLNSIREAVDQAAAKGGRESLLLMDGLALVASVPNRTVITAMHAGESAGNVFTNIDSAVVVAPVASTALMNHGLDSAGEARNAAE